METTIHMTTGKPYAHVKILNDDTSVQEKDVPLQALAAVFQEKEDELYMLPHSLFAEYQPDTHIEGLLLGRTNNTWTTGLFFVPAQKFYMNVAGEKSMMPYPSLLFLLTESGGTLRSSKCFTVKEKSLDQLRPESIIYPEYLTPDNMLRYLSPDSYSSSSNIRIIIGAVDNHACRKLLHEYFQHPQYLSENVLYYIDSANEFSCGEIVIGKRTYRDIAAPDRVHYYPDIMQDNGKAAYEMSCEELNSSAPQHLATNGLAADLIFSYLSQLLMAGEQAPLAPGGIIYFDALKLFSRFDIYEEVRHGKIVK